MDESSQGSGEIYFQEIFVESNKMVPTVMAIATISEEQGFQLDDKLIFKGTAMLNSSQQKIKLDGFAKIKLSGAGRNQWFKVDKVLDPDKMEIDIGAPVTARGDTISVGIHLRMDSVSIYHSLFERKIRRMDRDLFTANGSLKIDNNTDEIYFGNLARINRETKRGNYLRLNDRTGDVFAEGKIDFDFNFGGLQSRMAGTIRSNKNNSKALIKSVWALDFGLPKELQEIFEEDLSEGASTTEEINFETKWITNALLELDHPKNEKKLIQSIRSYNRFEISTELQSVLLLSNLNLNWNQNSRTFISEGKIGLAATNQVLLGSLTNGVIELGARNNGDFFTIYFELPNDDGGQSWYYFSYSKNIIRICSSNDEFNEMISILDSSDRTFINRNGKNYTVTLASTLRKNSFLESINQE